jgi:hypothetical protein
MVKRPGDGAARPPGGKAAARLAQFEEARSAPPAEPAAKAAAPKDPPRTEGKPDAKPKRRGD